MSETNKTKPEIDFYDGEAPTELVITDIEVGDGAEATPGATVDVHYLGVDLESGEEFDSSWAADNRSTPRSAASSPGGSRESPE